MNKIFKLNVPILKDNKEVKKMNKEKFNKKKLLIFGLPILCLVLVSAALLTYYGQIQQDVNVEQAVVLSDSNGVIDSVFTEGPEDELTDGSLTLVSDVYTVKNIDPVNSRNVKLVTICRADDNEDGIYDKNCANEVTTSYVGVLELTKKVVVDGKWTPTSDKIEITYTVVGDKFEVTGDLLIGYVLVYAMDNENRFQNYATVMRVEDVSESLPMQGDWNAGLEANYCGNVKGDEYTHCRGAKIWAIPESVIIEQDNGDGTYALTWADMANYYWETDLIVYSNNAGGIITLPAEGGFNFMVENTFAGTGSYRITTEVLPA